MKGFKPFVQYVSLNVLGMLGISCYILADTFFVSRALGARGLAALSLTLPVYGVIASIGMLLGTGGGTRYTVQRARGETGKGIFSGVAAAGVVVGVFGVICGIFFAEPLGKLLGATGETLPLTAVYMRVLLCFAPAFLMNSILLGFVRNDGNPALCMAAMITSSLSNVLLDYVFMFPLGWGMFGAAFATGLAPLIGMAVLSLHFLQKKNNFRFSAREISGKELFRALPLGLSAFVTELSSGIVMAIFNLQVLRFAGDVGVAAYSIIANIALVCTAVFTGIAQGVQPLAGDAYGRGDVPQRKAFARYALFSALILAVLFNAGGWIFGDKMVAVFNSEGNTALAALAEAGMRVYFIGFFFAGANIAMAAVLSASGNAGKGFAVSLTRGCFAIVPLALLLPLAFGLNGVWASYVLAEVSATAVLVISAKLIQQKGRKAGHVSIAP